MDLPATLPGNGFRPVVERLVERLEEPVVDGVDLRVRRHIHPEQDPVRVAKEEGPRRVRLAAELAEPRGDVDVEVRVFVEQAPDEPEILRGATEMGADERRPRMTRDEPPESGQQVVERWKSRVVGPFCRPGRPEMPVRVGVELLPALVPGVERLEEGDRVGDVDDDREVKLCGGGPERIEAPVVDRDETAVWIARPQSEQLPDLEPARSRAAESRSRAASVSPNAGSAAQPS